MAWAGTKAVPHKLNSGDHNIWEYVVLWERAKSYLEPGLICRREPPVSKHL